MHPDAFIVRNSSLRESIARHRQELLAFHLEVREELQTNANSSKYGHAFTNRSVFLRPAANEYIDALVAKFSECLHLYEISGVELWLGGGGRENATPSHNDGMLYLKPGTGIRMQFWLLLEACETNEGYAQIEAQKGALECLVPIAPGPFFPSMDMNAIWTPSGAVAYRADGIVGGDEIEVGDLLVFKNGVIHRADGGAEGMLRAALCFRAELKAELATADYNYALWFRDVLRKSGIESSPKLAGNPYFRHIKEVLLDRLPEVPYDPKRLAKTDRNDPQWLATQIQNCRFAI